MQNDHTPRPFSLAQAIKDGKVTVDQNFVAPKINEKTRERIRKSIEAKDRMWVRARTIWYD